MIFYKIVFNNEKKSALKCELVSQSLRKLNVFYIQSTVTAFGAKRPCI